MRFDEYIKFMMNEALNCAKEAPSKGEFPVGAIAILNKKIISRSSNQTQASLSFLRHAEICALEDTSKKLGTKYINNCEVFVTLEPCMMCLHAMNLARVKKVFFGAFNVNDNPVFHYLNYTKRQKIGCSFEGNIFGGFLEDECSQILQKFFAKKHH